MNHKLKIVKQVKKSYRRYYASACILATFLIVLNQGCQVAEDNQASNQADSILNSLSLSQVSEFYQPRVLRTELLMGEHINNIRDALPEFSWIIDSENGPFESQSAYQIQLWQQNHDITKNVLWDSGNVNSSNSVAVSYKGPALSANASYQWRVKVWGKSAAGKLVESAWSQPQTITMANALDNGTSRYDLVGSLVPSVSINKLASGRYLIDFGKSAFGYLDLSLTSDKAGEIAVYFGERGNEHGIITKAQLHKKSSVRYYKVPLKVNAKSDVYRVNPPRDKRNTKAEKAIVIPGRFGRIAPFRYVEIEVGNLKISDIKAQQIMVHYPFDDYAASFISSDDTLNAVWDLSKYSMKATSFAGVYVDGDRERIPYEADAYINQLSHYLVDSEYTLARYSHEYLLAHPTWPTEWKQHSIMMAWMDWMYTGDLESLQHHFITLKKEKTLEQLARADGLLVSFPDQNVRPPKNRDIIDWPASERDNFDFKPVNAVINAFHYLNLKQMAEMAKAIDKNEDYLFYQVRAEQVYRAFNEVFYQKELGIYIDGEGSTHAGFHANVAALAFGLVPTNKQARVVELIKEKGMAGSVYFAQYLLEALYLAGESDYALSLMTAKTQRSWFNMIRVGSTITLEAWDDVFKQNQDWNHAWGAVPGNIVGRFILGVKPLSPGLEQIEIAPNLASLTSVRGKVPTIKGDVIISAEQVLGKSLNLTVNIPNNSKAKIILPQSAGKAAKRVTVNGKTVPHNSITGHLGDKLFNAGNYYIDVSY